MRKLRLKEIKHLFQGHATSKKRSRDVNPPSNSKFSHNAPTETVTNCSPTPSEGELAFLQGHVCLKHFHISWSHAQLSKTLQGLPVTLFCFFSNVFCCFWSLHLKAYFLQVMYNKNAFNPTDLYSFLRFCALEVTQWGTKSGWPLFLTRCKRSTCSRGPQGHEPESKGCLHFVP